LTALRLQIRSVADSRVAPLGRVVPACDDQRDVLISNERLGAFRCCLGQVDVEDGAIALPRDVALAIGARLGDPVRYVTARPEQ
jgi:arginine/ornithine N-succinyltransferase beta subunit